jgi:CubicO group peptidase (beta-lactamase class C family)
MRRTIALAALFSLTSAGRLHAEPPNENFQSRLDVELGKLVHGEEPGLAICVASDGSITNLSARGVADLEHKIPMTVDTPVYIASVAKGFTAVAILKLVEEKRLSLDDHLNALLPGLPAYLEPVTVRHLLTHTSGIPEYDDAFASKPGLTNADVMSFLRAHSSLVAPAGSKWSYSNAGFVLLAEVFAHVSGESLDAYLTKKIFQPLGMANTFILTEGTNDRVRAIGYRQENGAWIKADYRARTRGPGGIFSSARDLCTGD